MRVSRLIVAAILFIVGLVWIGQGTGKIAGSAMSGTTFWAAAGVILVVLAVVILVRERRLSAQGARSRSG
jgi:divalent metal cation (Fe/Co/Zn/Cd) transporter